MKSLFEKFVKGVRTDVQGTIIKTIRYAARIVGTGIADGLFFIFIAPLLPLPARTQARIKHAISPTTQLDYTHGSIKLHVDSLLDFYRARACEKEPETVHWIETCVEEGDVFYDVGANIGAYSFIAYAHCGGKITILAFEPGFSNFHQLCKNIIINKFDKSITPYMIALSRSSGLLSFNCLSLEAGSADHWLGEDLSTKESAPSAYTQRLLAFSMDHLIKEFGFPVPNHIKLDVDGAEVDVLHGAKKTLCNNKVKSMLVEVRDVDDMSDQVHKLLMSAGFYLASKTDRGDGQIWNCVYLRGEVDITSIL